MDDEAIYAYKEAITANPEDPNAYDHLGDVYLKSGQYMNALGYYDKALDIDPKSVEFLKDKGLALFNLEEYTQSVAYYDKALTIKPNHKSVSKLRDDVLVKLEEIDRLKKKIDLNLKPKVDYHLAHRRAIIIGINKYESDLQMPFLSGAENDAQEICERLRNNGNFDISENDLLLGQNATRKKILSAISEIFRNEKSKNDLVTFYFACYIMMNDVGEAFIAPYDMDPDDPYVSGINMKELRNVISKSENNASVAMFLDCCYAGRATQDTRGVVLDRQETRNLLAVPSQKLVEPIDQSHNLEGGRGRIILASLEANAITRELKDCTHFGRDDPHPHGAFSFHLIEGLDGKAADTAGTGIITIGSIRSYIEEQMKNEGKQIPLYYIAEASRIDSVRLAISQRQYNANIRTIIESAEEYVAYKTGILELPDIQSLAEAAKKVGDLISLDPNNEKIPILRKKIEDGISSYLDPGVDWFNKNKGVAREKINEIEIDLYDRELHDLVFGLNFNELSKNKSIQA